MSRLPVVYTRGKYNVICFTQVQISCHFMHWMKQEILYYFRKHI